MGEKEGNAGVYQTAVAEGPKDVRGALGYVLPGVNSSILVIYFDAVKCRLLFVDSGTVIDSNIVDKVEAEGKKKVSGSLVLEHGGGSNFVVRQKCELRLGPHSRGSFISGRRDTRHHAWKSCRNAGVAEKCNDCAGSSSSRKRRRAYDAPLICTVVYLGPDVRLAGK
jgi:hypothetical protein